MPRYIDALALYEQTEEWEARALAIVEKLNSKPLGEMDVNEITEWRKWSCILNERSAFKHDVADATTADVQELTLENAIDYLNKIGWMQEHDRVLTESAQPEPRWIPVTERLPEEGKRVLVTDEDGEIDIAHIIDYSDIGEGIEWWAYDYKCNPTAWRECPKPYERSEDG